jgi:hypothetical protein
MRFQTGLNIANGCAAGAVDENAIEGVTNAAADRVEPLALDLATSGRRH